MSSEKELEELRSLSVEEQVALLEEKTGIVASTSDFYVTADDEEGEGEPVAFNPSLIVSGRNREAILRIIAATPAVTDRKRIEALVIILSEDGQESYESFTFMYEGTVDEFKEKFSGFNLVKPPTLIHYAQRLSLASYLKASVEITAPDADVAIDVIESIAEAFAVPGFNFLHSTLLGEEGTYREFVQFNETFEVEPQPEPQPEQQTWHETVTPVDAETKQALSSRVFPTYDEQRLGDGVEDTTEQLYARAEETDALDDSLLDDDAFTPAGGPIPERHLLKEERNDE